MVARELDRPEREHAAARRGHLEHLVVGDARQHPGVRHNPRIRGVDARHVRVDLAGLRAERGRQRDGRRVRAAPAERRDVPRGRDTLKAGDDGDVAGLDRGPEPVGADVEDLRPGVGRVGDDPGLGPREADGRLAPVDDRHAQQRDRRPFTGCQQHVHLAAAGDDDTS